MITITIEQLTVHIDRNREELGSHAAQDAAAILKKLLQQQDEVRVVFAAAPSQNEFLYYLVRENGIEWDRVVAFHMDEYIGLPPNSLQLFSKYLHDHFFSLVQCKQVNIIDSQASDVANECMRYAQLLNKKPIDITFMGIGENGHIAFNDPPVADFNDSKLVKIVELDTPCRQQQVNDGCFSSINRVPTHAITLTIPALISSQYLSIVVPGERKAVAVRDTLYEKISTSCPASVIRAHKNAVLYLDYESASKVQQIK